MDKRSKILAAAQRLFQERGLGMVTMEEIAKAGGMGKSSMYYYFKSKEEIFDVVFEAEIDGILLETMKSVNASTGVVEKLTTFAMVKFEMTRKRKSLYRAAEANMDAETLSRYNEIKKKVHLSYIQKEKLIVQQILLQESDSGLLKLIDDNALEQAAFIFLSALRGMNREINLFGSKAQPDTVLATFCKIYYQGLQ